jgi:hypothetical protein
MVLPHTTVQFAPSVAPRRTSVGRYSCLRATPERGLTTFVKTMLGPQNTSSSSVTASYTLTLFWMRTWSPITAALPTKTFCPSEQSRPMRAPAHTWTQCQMRVPSPISAP